MGGDGKPNGLGTRAIDQRPDNEDKRKTQWEIKTLQIPAKCEGWGEGGGRSKTTTRQRQQAYPSSGVRGGEGGATHQRLIDATHNRNTRTIVSYSHLYGAPREGKGSWGGGGGA